MKLDFKFKTSIFVYVCVEIQTETGKVLQLDKILERKFPFSSCF